MKTMSEILITQEGWERLHAELARLRGLQGSSNAEYKDVFLDLEPGDAALRYMQGEVSSLGRRISHLQEVLARAVPVASSDLLPGVVGVGSRVVVRWEDGGEESYVVVGPPEVDVQSNRISRESPVGRALEGRRTGEWVEVATPGGCSRLEIIAVN